MVILLDTHVAFWVITGSRRLTESMISLVKEADAVYFSQISVFEIELKHDSHPDLMPIDGKTFKEACLEAGMQELMISDEHIQEYGKTNLIHHDPYDRLLVATAKKEKMKFLTADEKIGKSSENCIVHL